MKAAVLGSSGYTGMLLLRILSSHPQISRVLPVSSSKAGEPLKDHDPGLADCLKGKTSDSRFISIEEAIEQKPDAVISALPHLASADLCGRFLDNDAVSVVIDLSADFRLKQAEDFSHSYGHEWPRADLQNEAVYGLADLFEKEIQKARLVANPGCYPTASLLPLIPLLQEIKPEGPVTINAMSGISGAGKKLATNNLFCERSENSGAYLPGTTHRHTTEITQSLPTDTPVYFTPHLIPQKRGIAATIFIPYSQKSPDLHSIYSGVYGNNPFIQLRDKTIPQTGDVWGSNRCDIGWHIEQGGIFLFSVIDNLIKGAAGQAIQNMNIRLGFDRAAGLRIYGEV